MRVSRSFSALLAPAAALVLGLSLAGCSVSFGGSEDGSADSGDATTEAAAQSRDDSRGSAGDQESDGPQETSAAGAVGSESPEDSEDPEEATGSDTSDITDPGWRDVIDNGNKQTVSGSYAVQGSGESVNLVGDLDGELAVQGSDVTVAAENVGSLTVQGSDVTVYVRSVDTVTIAGSDVKVYWLSGSPDVTDFGSDNVATQVGQG